MQLLMVVVSLNLMADILINWWQSSWQWRTDRRMAPRKNGSSSRQAPRILSKSCLYWHTLEHQFTSEHYNITPTAGCGNKLIILFSQGLWEARWGGAIICNPIRTPFSPRQSKSHNGVLPTQMRVHESSLMCCNDLLPLCLYGGSPSRAK